MSKPTTIKDIAAHVGVSNMTDSAVLGGGILKHVGVSQATRGRVLEAATSMQYRPNRAARDWGAAIKKYLGLLWACFALLALTALTASADPITGIYRITPRVQLTMCLDVNNFANAKRKYREWNDRRHLPGQRQLRPALVLRAHRQRLVPDRSAECRNQLPANPGYAQRQQRQRRRLREYLQRLWRPQPVVPPGIPRTDRGSRQLQEGPWRTAAAGRRAELHLVL